MVEDVTSVARGRCGDGFRLYAEIYALRLVEREHEAVFPAPGDVLGELLPAVAPGAPGGPR